MRTATSSSQTSDQKHDLANIFTSSNLSLKLKSFSSQDNLLEEIAERTQVAKPHAKRKKKSIGWPRKPSQEQKELENGWKYGRPKVESATQRKMKEYKEARLAKLKLP